MRIEGEFWRNVVKKIRGYFEQILKVLRTLRKILKKTSHKFWKVLQYRKMLIDF